MGNRGRLQFLNDTKLVLNEHEFIYSFRINSEPSDVLYSPNQFLPWTFFATSYSKTALVTCLVYKHHRPNSHFINTSISVQRVSFSNISHTKMSIFLLEPHVFIRFLQHRRHSKKLVIAMIFNALCSFLLMSHKRNLRPCFA